MNQHPENGEKLNELIGFMESQELVDVWCLGCGKFVKMNAVYAPYLDGEIRSCKDCRNKK
jgi:hypothetical protein